VKKRETWRERQGKKKRGGGLGSAEEDSERALRAGGRVRLPVRWRLSKKDSKSLILRGCFELDCISPARLLRTRDLFINSNQDLMY
jgi:hypothetical protein